MLICGADILNSHGKIIIIFGEDSTKGIFFSPLKLFLLSGMVEIVKSF